MAKQALKTHLEPEQKRRLEQIARSRRTSQARLVREAIQALIEREVPESSPRAVDEVWRRLLGGYYQGDGRPNDHDDIYR